MTHLSRDELTAWRDRPTEEMRVRVVAHLAACNACAADYAEIVRNAPADAGPSHFDPAEFAARGREMPAASRRMPPRTVLIGLAAAAGVLLAVFVWTPDQPPEPGTLRGGAAFEAVGPSGDVDRVEAFTWDAPEGANTFRLEISDAAGAVIHEARVTGRRAELPPDALSRLQSGVTYHWTIARLDARGETIEVAPARTFTIR